MHSDFLETNSDVSKEEAVERFILGYVNAKKEAYNANPRHFVETDEIRATELARMYGLYMTSGSDAHRIEDVGRGGMGS